MVADAIVFEASLSFIGGGLAPQEAASSWGSVIAFGKEMVQIGGWWATFFPGLLILLTVLALNVLSEGMSDAWAAPAARRATATKVGDAQEEAQPGSGEVVQLPGLAEAAQRLRERARPLPQGEPVLEVRNLSHRVRGAPPRRRHRRRPDLRRPPRRGARPGGGVRLAASR